MTKDISEDKRDSEPSVSPMSIETVSLESNDYVLMMMSTDHLGPISLDYSGSMSIAYLGSMSIDYLGSMSIDYLGSMSIDYLGSMSIDYLGSMSIDYLGSMSIDYLGSMSIDYLGSMSIDYLGSMSIDYLGSMSIDYLGSMSIDYLGSMSIDYLGSMSIDYSDSYGVTSSLTPSSVVTWRDEVIMSTPAATPNKESPTFIPVDPSPVVPPTEKSSLSPSSVVTWRAEVVVSTPAATPSKENPTSIPIDASPVVSPTEIPSLSPSFVVERSSGSTPFATPQKTIVPVAIVASPVVTASPTGTPSTVTSPTTKVSASVSPMSKVTSSLPTTPLDALPVSLPPSPSPSTEPHNAPVISVSGCISEDVTGSPFTVVSLSLEVETITTGSTPNFMDELNQGLLVAAADAFNFCPPISGSTTRPTNSGLTDTLYPRGYDSQDSISGVKVTDAVISSAETCVAEMSGATCHVVYVTFQVYSDVLSNSQEGSVAVLDVLLSHVETMNLIRTYEADIVAIREHFHDATVTAQQSFKSKTSPGPSNGAAITATIVIVTVLLLSLIVSAVVLVRRRHGVVVNDTSSSTAGDANVTATAIAALVGSDGGEAL